MAKSPILGGFSRSRSRDASDSTVINLSLEITETKDGRVPGFLFGASGLDLVGTLGAGPIRGVRQLTGTDTLYVVSGPQVFSLTPNGISTLCGTIGDETTPVSMFANNRQLMIVDGVGAWLVPGGYPLTGGVIPPATVSSSPEGGLYQVNDTITLQAATGAQSSYPVVTVTAISDNPVEGVEFVYPGTAYTNVTNAPTNPIEPQAGIGSGLLITVLSANGPITNSVVAFGGIDYGIGDTGIINIGSADAVYRVTSVSGGGVVTSYTLLNAGTAYPATGFVETIAEPAIPANLGSGLTINVGASGGPIVGVSLGNGGRGYVVGNVGFISSGSGDATYLVTKVGPFGTVAGFTITQGGSINDIAASFTQKSTSGSGSGFELTSPTYGAFVGLVPITVPFPAPTIGGVSDGFGVLVFRGQQFLAASDEQDLSTWGALSFGVADQASDNCMSLAVIHDEVYVFKQGNTEVWVDEGLANFPFGPLTGVHMEAGCMAPFSVAVADEELIWLSRNSQGQGVVVRAAAYQITPISTQALVAEFEKYPNLGDAIAYVRQEGGHVYYVITFPEANVTWCFDKTSSALVGYPIWTRMAAFKNGQFNRHWGNCFTPWRGSVTIVNTPSSYQPQSVTITEPTLLETTSGLTGLPASFSAAVFSVWLFIPDVTNVTGIVFGNQGLSAVPGLQITIQNDQTGSPQITVQAWDATATLIVVATYDFTTWTGWVNLLISIDAASNQLQAFTSTVTAGSFDEVNLIPISIVWSSLNPIGASPTQPWLLEPVL